MKKAAHSTSQTLAPEPVFTALSVGAQLLDTTWRIVVPVLALAILGILFDRHFGTKPWVTIFATVVGFGIAAWLVKRQLDAVNKTGDSK